MTGQTRPGRSGDGTTSIVDGLTRPGALKVPLLTVWFWVIKIATTAMGESMSDGLVSRFDPVLVVLVGFVGFAAALALQFRVRRYVAAVYWLAALMVSTFGTMAADVAHVGLGIPYLVSTPVCALLLVAVFASWSRTEHTVSIHSIRTTRRELFYWSAALATFALGTAAGDLTAVTFHLGYLSSGILFGVVFALPAIGYWRLALDPVVAFWWAYVATRPFGASFADWVAKPVAAGGLGHGQLLVSAVLGLVILVGVTVVTVTKVDDPNEVAEPLVPIAPAGR